MDESVIDEAVYAELRDTTGAEFLGELVDTFLEEGARHACRAARCSSAKPMPNDFGARLIRSNRTAIHLARESWRCWRAS